MNEQFLAFFIIEVKWVLGLLRESLQSRVLTIVLFSSWLCHYSGLNINVFFFIVFWEAGITFTIKEPFSPKLSAKKSSYFLCLSKYLEKSLRHKICKYCGKNRCEPRIVETNLPSKKGLSSFCECTIHIRCCCFTAQPLISLISVAYQRPTK